MITKEIPAVVRSTKGKGPVRRMRAEGKTPGVVYSGGQEALPLEFETSVLFTELLSIQGRNAVITLKLDDGTTKNALVKEIQSHPVKDTLYHTDFLEIDIEKPATFNVPISFSGKAKGVDLGGLLTTAKNEVILQGVPLSIPDECVIDVSDMAIGDAIKAGSIDLPEGVSLITDPETVCVSVLAP
ncbi:MAG: 50S ribosomal protein L25 [Desulfobulbaceae bacterium]|nr:MAG: 50S ribosomal protein L25 [Desulfobulbaceae bacterium]